MSTLYVDNLQPNLGSRVMAAGHVVQVKQAQYDTATTTNSGTPTTLMSVDITPTSTSSKILVSTQLWLFHTNYYTGYAGIFRGATDITLGTDTFNYDVNFVNTSGYQGSGIGVRTSESSGTSATNWAPYSFSHTLLDSPSTSSQLTYALKVWVSDAGVGTSYPLYINRATGNTNSPRPICTLTVQEIAQ